MQVPKISIASVTQLSQIPLRWFSTEPASTSSQPCLNPSPSTPTPTPPTPTTPTSAQDASPPQTTTPTMSSSPSAARVLSLSFYL